MSTTLKWRRAEQLFHAGKALFEENRYEQALIELRKAEEAFRKLDARGHPFGSALSNGVSGLAETLALSGRCYQELGDFAQAVTCYETSLINANFEKTKPFLAFVRSIRTDMISCYEKGPAKKHACLKFGATANEIPLTLPSPRGGEDKGEGDLPVKDEQTLRHVLDRNFEIDPSFLFPFSLPGDMVPLARLYELAPDRYPHVQDFYVRARNKDSALRRANKEPDESRMKKAAVSIWIILGALWAAYSLVVSKALFFK